MADVSLVQVGYAREIDSVFHARCTIGLITLDEDVIEHDEHTQMPEIAPVKNILFDCGAAHESKAISEKINAEHVDAVLCSHGHSDHVGNLNLFPKAIIAVGRDISCGEQFRNPRLLPSDKAIGACLLRLSNETITIKYITTPGHTGGCCSLIIEGALRFDFKKYDKFAFVGDLWDEKDDESFYKSLSENPEQSVLSRSYILNTVKPDLIFPGHGPPFAPQKQY